MERLFKAIEAYQYTRQELDSNRGLALIVSVVHFFKG